MPKLYPDGITPPSSTKEYYKLKMREYRARNKGKLKAPKPFWKLEVDGKIYIFKDKKDMKISRIKQNEVDKTKHIIFNEK